MIKKRIIQFKIAKRNFYRKIYQTMADNIYSRLETSKTDVDTEKWYILGMQLDIWVTYQHDIKLK